MVHDRDVALSQTQPPQAIWLRDFPVALFMASSPQWSDVLRDYLLRGIGGADQPYDADDIARSVRALDLVRFAAEDTVTSAADVDPIDVLVELEGVTVGDYALLQGALDHGRKLALSGETLTVPSLPEVVALRDWMCDEVMSQAAGGAARRWQFAARMADAHEVELADWDRAIAPPDDVAWVVGDDHNRIIAASGSALDLLGWSAEELVGQRLLAIIPDRLRERHITAFTRGVVNDEHRLLGVPLELPALMRDGREVEVLLTLSRHAAPRGRAVFLARLEPLRPAATSGAGPSAQQ